MPEHPYVPIQPPRDPAQVYVLRIPVDYLGTLAEAAEEEGILPNEWIVRRATEALNRRRRERRGHA